MQNEKVRTETSSQRPIRDIEARTFDPAVRVVRLCKSLVAKPGVSRTIGHQLLRAGTSIGANVEDAQAAQSRADFLCKMCIALKESREAEYWLRLLAGAEIVKPDLLAPLSDENNQICSILGAIVRSTRRRAKGVLS